MHWNVTPDALLGSTTNVLLAKQLRHVNLTLGCSIQHSKNRYFCPRFDGIGHHLWAALASKIAEGIWFWCMLMLGLGPPSMRLSPDHAPLIMPARVSDYCCLPRRIDCLLYIHKLPCSLYFSLVSWCVLSCVPLVWYAYPYLWLLLPYSTITAWN